MMGCGSIGTRIAQAIHDSFGPFAQISGLYDIDEQKSSSLAQHLRSPGLSKTSLDELLSSCDVVVEAVYAPHTAELVKAILAAGKSVMVMSTGSLLGSTDLFAISRGSGVSLLVPSGAVAGIDAIRAAAVAGIEQISLTTYKPPASLAGAPYLQDQQISIHAIKKETVIFEGDVQQAVAAFPQNINVAATVALASNARDKLRVRIVTSPEFTHNRHEIHVSGPFGHFTTVTENFPCPDNPKTSYLAVLSGIETLRSFCQSVKIGT